ncbi:c-type cytochrome [Deinococcus apachensis]|uniref:c-type cytochrome n=1 Tax=Deinococcus apachensis TaxID=309886 RepID=UPI0003A14119|nr:cytochrome c [Deinococcus apachensis]
MKNTFAVTMTLLLALALGGSFAGYRIATTPNEAAEASKGGAESIGDPTTQDVKSESVPSAREAATQGSNDLSTAQGNVMEQDQAGGAKAGENGAVAADGGEDSGGAGADAGTTSNQNGGTTTDGGTKTTETGSGTESGGTGSTGGGSGDASGEQTGGTGTTGDQSSTDQTGGDQTTAPQNNSLRGEGQPNVPSPTVQGSEETQLGQTGASNTEKATAASGGLSDSKAAEVSSALSGDTAEGQKKFVATCSGCHGQNGEGGIGPALNAATGPGSWDIGQFEAAVRQGHAPDHELGPIMPRFTKEQLSDEDLTDIYAYLKTLRQ